MLVNQGLFGAAAVVGAGAAERPPLFEIVSAAQTIVPGSEDAITTHLMRAGYEGRISTREVPAFIGDSIERCLADSLGPLAGVAGGGAPWNDMFWAASSAILDQVDAVLQLRPEKLAASRRVLSEYGNMFGVSVIFILDELRRRREKGEGLEEWG
ncbi:hypothetical protein ACP4OV_016816 [Aristida adscensionis]